MPGVGSGSWPHENAPAVFRDDKSFGAKLLDGLAHSHAGYAEVLDQRGLRGQSLPGVSRAARIACRNMPAICRYGGVSAARSICPSSSTRRPSLTRLDD